MYLEVLTLLGVRVGDGQVISRVGVVVQFDVETRDLHTQQVRGQTVFANMHCRLNI